MALKKTYAAKVTQQTIRTDHPDGSYTIETKPVLGQQRDVDMHPFEEAYTRAHWATNDLICSIPPKPSQKDEHEWLIEHGPEYVKAQREAWQKAHDAAQPAIIKAQELEKQLNDKWNLHANNCHANGLDYDVYPDGTNLTIPKGK
jgi:hypothetical protein